MTRKANYGKLSMSKQLKWFVIETDKNVNIRDIDNALASKDIDMWAGVEVKSESKKRLKVVM